MKSLAISLGHNSSAVLIEDGRVVAGYEEERFTEVKSDSVFPANAIMHLNLRFGLDKHTDVYVGHWFTDARLPTQSNKYWNYDAIKTWFPYGEIHSLSKDITHHDSHLLSATVFAGPEFTQDCIAVVADGFGSFGECLTVYHVRNGAHRILHRVFGFEKSMGLLYQYATAFMGMKMHNHEYKMLAYEVHIDEVLSGYEVSQLDDMVHEAAGRYLKSMRQGTLSNEFDPLVDLSALPNVQNHINVALLGVLRTLGMAFDKTDERSKRIVISYFVQRVVEQVIMATVGLYRPHNLLVAGGLFYNVKLNHKLADSISGKFCAMPLAGDQGAALGVYEAYNGDLEWPDTLCWGPRDLSTLMFDLPRGAYAVSPSSAADRIADVLRNKGWVNIVRGNMEYGPRALCHTSTLALPTEENVEIINRANDRTVEMPFAPVMTAAQAEDHFEDTQKIHKSLEYMIMARAYKDGKVEKVKGAAHWYPDTNQYTGRPQVTNDPLMVTLLNEFGPLVNTSFNFHGVPIVRDVHQVLKTHNKQVETAPDLNPTTLIIN